MKKCGYCKKENDRNGKYCSTKCVNLGIAKSLTGMKQSEETKEKRRKSITGFKYPKSAYDNRRGEKNGFYKQTHTVETREKISEANKGRKAWNKNIPMREETKIKLRDGQIKEKGSNWQGGKSYEKYGLEFDNELREKVRIRDGRKCQECNYTEKQLVKKLDVHHIDYNKKNNLINNLISLCRSCHIQTNYKRQDWTRYYNNRLIDLKVGQ